MKYQFICDHQEQFSLKRLCQVLCISRSAHYNWLTSKPGKWAQENTELLKEIIIIHKQSRQTYGSPRITPGNCINVAIPVVGLVSLVLWQRTISMRKQNVNSK